MSDWAVVLGASSGFGGATARALADAGLNIFGVHMDRKATLPMVAAVIGDVTAAGREALFFNMNAADAAKRAEAVAELQAKAGPNGQVKVLLHSLAFGTLKPAMGHDAADILAQPQIEMTLDVMASSLVYWTQAL